jgi:DNA-binding NtrC family response regulator
MLDVLLADDDPTVRDAVAGALEDAGHGVVQAKDGVEALSLFLSRPFDVVICDVQMPRMDGLTLFRRIRLQTPRVPVIVMTTYGQAADAAAVLRAGALDYVTKPFDPDTLVASIVRPIDERRALARRLEEVRVEGPGASPRFVARTASMRNVVTRFALLADSDVPILITGERGTGKKALARALHDGGIRRDGPFLIVPCASLDARMLEGELHDLEGGAGEPRDEWFRAAEGGTIVLDGIEHVPVSARAALLRVIQEPAAVARRDEGGGARGVRIVSLARESLADRAAAGAFLPPLFFRLGAVSTTVPPLRERREDLLPLVAELLARRTPPGSPLPCIEPRAIEAIARYPFPGNVTELRAALDYALALADGAPLDAAHLPSSIREWT